MKTRFWTVLCTVFLLILALTVSVFATDADNSWDASGQIDPIYATDGTDHTDTVFVFTDVAQTDWFYNNVMALYTAGVVNGFGDGSFRPATSVTTGEALKMILLAAGYAEPEAAASHWARGYLNLALDEQILDRGEITDLDVSISRGLVTKIAARAMKLTPTSTEYFFVDAKDDYTQALYEAGIVNGYAEQMFLPNRTLTRAELAAIVHRIYTYNDQSSIDDPIDSSFTLRTTEAGIEFIKNAEGFVEKPYWDYLQYSVGYGTKCSKDDYPNGITREEADTLLREKISSIETELNAYEKKNNLSFASNQYDALVSFTYNTGSGWMKNTRLSNYINSGVYTDNEFASAFGIWCHVGQNAEIHTGLISRRIREIKMYLYNDYSANDSGFSYVIFKSSKGKVEADVAVYRTGTQMTPYFEANCDGDVFLNWLSEDGLTYNETSYVNANLTLTAFWQSSGTGGTGSDVSSGEVWPDWGNENPRGDGT